MNLFCAVAVKSDDFLSAAADVDNIIIKCIKRTARNVIIIRYYAREYVLYYYVIIIIIYYVCAYTSCTRTAVVVLYNIIMIIYILYIYTFLIRLYDNIAL